jgi:hypothetical protein
MAAPVSQPCAGRRGLLAAVAACTGIGAVSVALAQPMAPPPAWPAPVPDAWAQGPASPAPPFARPSRWPGGDPFGWEAPLVDGAEVLFVDETPMPLSAVVPAAGPMNRFLSRPGAWYGVFFLPLSPGWPVQLWLSSRARSHSVRLLALDSAPWGTPSVAVPVPTRTMVAAGRPALASAPFALMPDSRADGVFLLIEQWRPAGDRPPVLWVQARSRTVAATGQRPWWSSQADAPPAPGGSLAPPAPAGPLSSPRTGADGVIELPIPRRLASPPPHDAWGPR